MDILERLRDMAGKKYHADWSSWVQKQCTEAANEIERLRSERISIEMYQQDWMPGFAAYLAPNGGFDPESKPKVLLNIGSLLSAVEAGDVAKSELPYFIAETLMHEVIHVLEHWAGQEFNEERVEALLDKYREHYGKEAQ